MFNALETKATRKFSYNKLLLLLLIFLYISPLSYELEQKSQRTSSAAAVQSATKLSSSSSSSSSTDNLIVKRDFELSFENFTCSNDDDNDDDKRSLTDHMQIVEKLSCNLNRNAKRRYLQMEMSFKRQINHFNFNILIILQRPLLQSTEKQFILLNLTSINGCDLLASKHQVTLMYWARTLLRQYSNLPAKCPLMAHTSYYIRGFKWEMEPMPAFFIEAPITIEFSYVFDNSTKIIGLIKAKLELKANKKFAVS